MAMTRNFKKPAAILAVAALQACATSADPSAATLRRERVESWQKLCDSRGFTRGTSDFEVCVMGYEKAAANPPVK
jgi:invasion protein IalB